MSYSPASDDQKKMEHEHIEKVNSMHGERPSRRAEETEQSDEERARIKRILRKCDMRILPVMSILYLLSFLDRTAIGNARIAGLAKDLKMTPLQYNASVTVFFILYGLLEVPSNLMLKKYGAKKWIPFIMLCWGIVMTFSAFVTTYGGLLAARIMLGGAEAGLFPGVTYYLTTWYQRSESQFRVGVFFGAATIAGAFGGLLAFGLTHIKTAVIKPWGWIFLVEGILTVAAAIWAFWAIVDSPRTAKFLTVEEQDILIERLKYDGVSVPMNDEYKTKFVVSGLLDWKVWMVFVIYVCSLTPVYSVALNLPAITVGLGYSGPNAQLITVPVYVFAAIWVIVLALVGDKYRLRSPVIIFGLFFAIVGYVMLYASYSNGVRYVGAFIAAAGAYGSFPGVVCLLTNNVGGRTKRSTEIGILVGIGGMAGMISSNIFPSTQGPHYSQGLLINIGLASLGIVTTVLNWLFLRAANKRKEAVIASGAAAHFTDAELADMGDESPFFVYSY